MYSKFFGGLITAAVSLTAMTAMTGAAQAQQVTFSSATGTSNTAFTYYNGIGDAPGNNGFSITPGQVFTGQGNFPFRLDPGSILDFTPDSFANEGNLMAGGMANEFVQNLSGGAFTLTSSGGQLLLAGTFTDANLFGTVGQSNGAFRVSLGDVNYQDGAYFSTSGLVNPGEFSFGLTGITPVLTGAVGGRFNDFTAGGTGTFSATAGNPIPEPSEWLAMGMAAVSVGGLMLRARRRRNSTSGSAVA
jgi:hypothetical protein